MTITAPVHAQSAITVTGLLPTGFNHDHCIHLKSKTYHRWVDSDFSSSSLELLNAAKEMEVSPLREKAATDRAIQASIQAAREEDVMCAISAHYPEANDYLRNILKDSESWSKRAIEADEVAESLLAEIAASQPGAGVTQH